MKKIFTILYCLSAVAAYAQPIERAFTFSGSLFDTITGNPINQKQITAQVSVLSASGTLLYRENQPNTATTPILMTNKYGYFDYKVGKGAATFGQFDTLNWATAKKLRTVITVLSTGAMITLNNDILPVPTALYAEKAKESQTLALNGSTLSISGTNSSVNLSSITNPSTHSLPQVIPTGGTLSPDPNNNPSNYYTCYGTNLDGSYLAVSVYSNYSYLGKVYILKKDPSGNYHVLNQVDMNGSGNQGRISSITIFGGFVYILFPNNQGNAISRISLTDYTYQNMTFNPTTPTSYLYSISNDGTNLILCDNPSSFKKYQIVSTALIDLNQNFNFTGIQMAGYIYSAYFDGTNYYCASANGSGQSYITKADVNKVVISETPVSTNYTYGFYTPTHLLYCSNLIHSGATYYSGTNMLMLIPDIIVTPVVKP